MGLSFFAIARLRPSPSACLSVPQAARTREGQAGRGTVRVVALHGRHIELGRESQVPGRAVFSVETMPRAQPLRYCLTAQRTGGSDAAHRRRAWATWRRRNAVKAANRPRKARELY